MMHVGDVFVITWQSETYLARISFIAYPEAVNVILDNNITQFVIQYIGGRWISCHLDVVIEPYSPMFNHLLRTPTVKLIKDYSGRLADDFWKYRMIYRYGRSICEFKPPNKTFTEWYFDIPMSYFDMAYDNPQKSYNNDLLLEHIIRMDNVPMTKILYTNQRISFNRFWDKAVYHGSFKIMQYMHSVSNEFNQPIKKFFWDQRMIMMERYDLLRWLHDHHYITVDSTTVLFAQKANCLERLYSEFPNLQPSIKNDHTLIPSVSLLK